MINHIYCADIENSNRIMAWSSSHFRLTTSSVVVLLVLCGGYSGLLGANAQLQLVNDFDGLPEPRAYIPDAGLLDFVYHNHDDMTKFLR